MPIRINLLAEQQAAEEARRRDPVKRAAWMAVVVVTAVLLLSAYRQFQISGVKSELAGYEARWKEMEGKFLQVSNDYKESGAIRKKLESLQRYTTNRFVWAPTLNALQFVADDQIRVLSFSGALAFKEEPAIVVPTNFTIARPSVSWWKFWASPPTTNIDLTLRNALGVITNRTNLLRFQSDLIVATNIAQSAIQILARADVTKPETVSERASLAFRLRDYSNQPGHRDQFYAALTNHPHFKVFSGRTNTSLQLEAVQQELDPSDLINPADPFMPFKVEFRVPEKIRTNE